MLEKINNPSNLKQLPIQSLPRLASEIRHTLLNSVSKTGGHLASSLGVVELTIALHYVYNSPKDKIVWDVGHQAYVHKLLTGRKELFNTLRNLNGISGFPKREESEHDAFGVGHASTSISAALGIANARDLNNENYKVIAVIGDGSLTGGLAYEALNNAGSLRKDMLVILNDNKMSISENVGAMSKYLNRLITTPLYNRLRREVEHSLHRRPLLRLFAKATVDTVKNLMVPGLIFESLNFRYFGPINGHDLPTLIETLKRIKNLKGPKLLHVITKKGKGYVHAEQDATKFHGTPPFDLTNGNNLKKPGNLTYTEVFGNTLSKLAMDNYKIVAITAAMAPGTGLERFSELFSDRFYDVGIAEEHAVTFAAGLATQGIKPVVAIYSTFLQRSYDQIVHDVCLQNLPVVFAIDRAGLVGHDGPTHHGSFDLSYLRHIPNLVLMAPKDENELQHMLKTAINHNGPVAIRYPRGEGQGVILEEPLHLPIGKAEVLTKGKDLVIFSIGTMVDEALKAANELRKDKINTTVVNARFIKPLDDELILHLAAQTKNIICIEENAVKGGFGSAVLELLTENKIKANTKLLGIPDKFITHGSTKELWAMCGLTSENIVNTAKEMVKKR